MARPAVAGSQLAASAPLLADLERIGVDVTPAPPVLCHNTPGHWRPAIWPRWALPPLEMAMFRGAVTSYGNYVSELVDTALTADGSDRRHADRVVRHTLLHLPTRRQLEQLLVAARSREE